MVDAIGPRTVHKHIHSIEDAALPPSHSMSRHSSNKTDPELSSPGSRSRCISSEIGVSCAATTDATSDDNNPADTSAYFTDR